VEAFETRLNDAHVERAAAYNVSARAEGKEETFVAEIKKEEEEPSEEKPQTVDNDEEIPSEIVRTDSKTSDEQENVAPDLPKVATPPTSPPRRSRRAAA
jgi:condensin complex subunit 1